MRAVGGYAGWREHGNGIALIPARTETAMFLRNRVGAADGVLFLKGGTFSLRGRIAGSL